MIEIGAAALLHCPLTRRLNAPEDRNPSHYKAARRPQCTLISVIPMIFAIIAGKLDAPDLTPKSSLPLLVASNVGMLASYEAALDKGWSASTMRRI
jgi:hypothetical protein